MPKFIVHLGTDTIICADECLLLDSDDIPEEVYAEFTGEPYWDDSVVLRIADTIGVPLVETEEV